MAKGQDKTSSKNAKNAAPSAKTFGRYKVLSPLGQGAMASVFLAEDPSLGRLVAIKVIHSHLAGQADLLTRFTSEAKTAAALRSPNIVEVFDYGVETGSQYLVMEYIDGPTLQHVLNLQMGEPLSPLLAVCLTVQAAEGLLVAERKSVVHRDIKPENLMLTSQGLLKIADFGIAHINEQNLTRTGSLLGSPSYMAPEQVEGEKPTHQTDMFALGAVFYACLTGRKPFNGPNIPAVFRAICELPHKPVEAMVEGLDTKLVELSNQLLNKKPEERGGGTKALSGQLRQWLNQQGIYDPTDPVRELLTHVQDAGNRTLIEKAPESGKTSAKPEPKPKSKPEPEPKLEPGKAKPESVNPPEGKTRAQPGAPATSPRASSLEAPIEDPLTSSSLTAPTAPAAQPTQGDAAKSKLEQTDFGAASTSRSVPAASRGKSTPGALTPVDPKPSPLKASLAALPKWALPALGGAVAVLILIIVLLVSGGSKPKEEPASPPASEMAKVQPAAAQPGAAPLPDTSIAQPSPRAEPAPTAQVAQAAAASSPASTSPPKAAADSGASAETTASATATAAAPVSDSTVLNITSAPPFAEVFLGTRFIGTTPLKGKKIPATRYKLSISHRRFATIDTVVRLKPGTVSLKFRFTQEKGE